MITISNTINIFTESCMIKIINFVYEYLRCTPHVYYLQDVYESMKCAANFGQ